jgi:cytochrome c oxidase subunit 3
MAKTVTSLRDIETIALGSQPPGRPDDGGRSGGREPQPSVPEGSYRLAVLFALASISMLFLGFTSAYIVRQGLGGDWRPLDPPAILWANTAVLLISSATFTRARALLRREAIRESLRWLAITGLLGLLFLLGQYSAWRELAARGIYLHTNPHSSFFYLLTAAHGIHVLGGLLALGYLALLGWRRRLILMGTPDRMRRYGALMGATALYWHFMDGLWVYLFILLFLWR